ncbi:coiled-coil domain-containing protein 34 isoform 2-T2 [Anomaloglossus baeobatrachus]|uniref:coiled-coil domain-containing protein 34 isoform X2 n=1 Tax=Anomaloglossus baeobatrachus TaxID=238106 RepID=UPI003F506608
MSSSTSDLRSAEVRRSHSTPQKPSTSQSVMGRPRSHDATSAGDSTSSLLSPIYHLSFESDVEENSFHEDILAKETGTNNPCNQARGGTSNVEESLADLKLSPWEIWLLGKERQGRLDLQNKLSEELKQEEERRIQEQKKEQKKRLAEEQHKEWVRKKQEQERKEKEQKLQNEKQEKELEEQQKHLIEEKSKERYEEWLNKKKEEEQERKKRQKVIMMEVPILLQDFITPFLGNLSPCRHSQRRLPKTRLARIERDQYHTSYTDPAWPLS